MNRNRSEWAANVELGDGARTAATHLRRFVATLPSGKAIEVWATYAVGAQDQAARKALTWGEVVDLGLVTVVGVSA